MKAIKKPIGVLDKYGKGEVKYIDFTYIDHIIIWVEYKKVCKAFFNGVF